MASDKLKSNHDANRDFRARTPVAVHMPGFISERAEHGHEVKGGHRLRPRDQKDVPQVSFAVQLAQTTKKK
jgi:hypothetical protein